MRSPIALRRRHPSSTRRREPIAAVVDQLNGLVIPRHRRDRHHGTERLLAHDAHVVAHVPQNARRNVRRAFPLRRKARLIHQRLRSRADRLLHWPRTDSAASARTIGPSVVAGLRGSSRRYALVRANRRVDEAVVDASIDVHALHGAARLTGVEERAVHHVLDGMLKRASARTYAASLPPSSSPVPMNRFAAARCTRARPPPSQ
jgi:hypothetical protein